MAKKKFVEEFSREEIVDHALEQMDTIAHYERYLNRLIVAMHDEFKLTFREIGADLNMAHSWAYKLYKKGKQNS